MNLLLLILLVLSGIFLFYQLKIKVTITPVVLVEDTRPLAVARVEMDLPASWEIAFYKSEIYFDFQSILPQLTIYEIPLDEKGEDDGNFNPELFPEYQQRLPIYLGDSQISAPDWLHRPFKGLAMVNHDYDSLMYVAAMKMDNFILHVSINTPVTVARSELDADYFQRHFEEQLKRVFEIYEAVPVLHGPDDFRTRFGRIKQSPEQYFVTQTVNVDSPGRQSNYGATVMSMGDCRSPEDRVCRSYSQFFEPYKEMGSFSETLQSLASGYHRQVLESGERNINGLSVYANAAIRKQVMPWSFDGGWDALVTCLNIHSDPQVNKSGQVKILVSPEDMDGIGFDQRAYSHFYNTITKIWFSVRPIG